MGREVRNAWLEEEKIATQKCLRRSKVEVTMIVYAHVNHGMHKATADRLDRLRLRLPQLGYNDGFFNGPEQSKKSLTSMRLFVLSLVRLAGLEPATFSSVDRCSIQLSYRRV